MKRLLRSPGVQAFLGWVLGTYLRLILRTVRWRHENLACVEPVLADDTKGAIGLLWHGRIPLSLATAPQWWRKRTKILVSPSADGEFTLEAAYCLGNCAAGPSVMVDNKLYGRVTPERLDRILAEWRTRQ